MLGIVVSLFLAPALFFPSPPAQLPEEWKCEIVEVWGEEPCLPSVAVSYCYPTDRAFLTHYKPKKIGQDTVCLPYQRSEMNLLEYLDERGEVLP